MSDFTDKVDEKRRKEIHYKTALESFKVELKDFEGSKKERILYLAKLKKETGCPGEEISERVGDDLEGYLSKQYVRKILGDEFKNKNKTREQAQTETNEEILCATSSAIDTEQKKQPLLVTNNGETVDQNTESQIDPIYGGKSFSQMQKEAAGEIREDKEETLENPRNKMPLLSDQSPEFREMQARLAEQDDMIRQMAEDRDHAVSKHAEISKRYALLKGGSKDDELLRVKAENNNLRTLLADVDKEAVQQETGLKEVEVFKLISERISWLLNVSKSSQRTLFFLVNPKTNEIKAIKTDVDMHKIQAKRAAGVI